jgi:hypothetical protein
MIEGRWLISRPDPAGTVAIVCLMATNTLRTEERRAELIGVLAEAIARSWVERARHRSLSGRELGLPCGGHRASMSTPPPSGEGVD